MFFRPCALRNQASSLALVWLLVLLSSAVLYTLGLPGSFIFDDSPNLSQLNSIDDGNWSAIISFSLQGIAGPGGRPLSLLSFALQHSSWPRDPGAFKAVNIAIHLFNGSLLLWLFLTLRFFTASPSIWPPFAAAALWLIWPVQASTVLYVVQRMTLLSATCMFLGLALYVEARRHQSLCSQTKARLLFLCSLAVGLPIGILFKENAIVFPLLALCIECTLLKQAVRPPRAWLALLWAPLMAFIAYLALINRPWLQFGHRDFSLHERLLTEGRVLWMYAQQIVLPSTRSLRFLYDNYPVSRDLVTPVTTAVGWGAWIILVAIAWRVRERYAAASFGLLFFLASHIVESSILPLELVFEHRNYVGSASIAYAMVQLGASSKLVRPPIKAGIASCYLLVVLAVAANVLSLWGHPLEQKQVWYTQNPESARVKLLYGSTLALEGYVEQGAAVFEHSGLQFPNDVSFPLATMEVACRAPELRPTSLAHANDVIEHGNQGMLSGFAYLDRMTSAFSEHQCPVYTSDELIATITAAQKNPIFKPRLSDLQLMEGIIYSSLGDTAKARQQLQLALSTASTPAHLIQAATWELSNHNLVVAREYIDKLQELKFTKRRQFLAIQDDVGKLEARYAEMASLPSSPLNSQQPDQAVPK